MSELSWKECFNSLQLTTLVSVLMFYLGYTKSDEKHFYTAKKKYLTNQDVIDLILTARSFLLSLIQM